MRYFLLALVFVLAAGNGLGAAEPFAESGGLVVMEVESEGPAGDWSLRTDISGYTGSGYFYATDRSRSSPGNGLVEYPIVITNGGDYQLQWRSRIAMGSSGSEHNDSWARMVDANGNPVPPVENNNDSTGNNWFKVHMNKKNQWAWDAKNHDNVGRAIIWPLQAGQEYRFQLSYRSEGHAVDRIVLWTREGGFDHDFGDMRGIANNNNQLTALSESDRSGGGGGGGGGDGDGSVTISGERKQYHKITLDLQGPEASEGGSPNPFTDYRMTVTFSNGGTTLVVPGYFAADGSASESSATSGTVWRAHLNPIHTGTWSYQVDFRSGSNSALGGGNPMAPYDGVSGSFTVNASDKSGLDFRSPDHGRLDYVGEHALRWQGSGDYFYKVGMNHPEVFLEFEDFDNTNTSRDYSPHVGAWNSGDPTWKSGKGKGIIGVINYLSTQGLNVHYFLTMNSQGDGQEAYPWTNSESIWDYDVSKLDQWQIVFDHMMSKGLMAHFVFDEQENQNLFEHLDDSSDFFADSRKLYYREMIARFGYLNAVTWNLGEENGWQEDTTYGKSVDTSQRKARATYVADLTPYDDHIVVHNGPASNDNIFNNLVGSSDFTGPSLQGKLSSTSHGNGRVAYWRQQSAASGRKWVVCYDEPYTGGTPGRDTWRQNALWASLSGGAAGCEIYSNKDTSLQDYTTFSNIYGDMNRAKNFLNDYQIPFWAMQPDNDLVSSGWCLATPGSIYLIYLNNGGSTDLDLDAVGDSYSVAWFDPRNGGGLQTGSVATVSGGGTRSLGNPPSNSNDDWVILVTSGNGNLPPLADAGADQNVVDSDDNGSETVTLDGSGSADNDGSIASYAWNWNGGSAAGVSPSVSLPVGSTTITLTITDDDGASASDSVLVTITSPGGGGGGDGAFLESGGLLVIEAEHYEQIVDNGDHNGWQTANNVAGHVAEGYLTSPGNAANGTWGSASEATYQVEIASSGSYQVWVRRYIINSSVNSFHFGVDDELEIDGADNDNNDSNQWVWKLVGSTTLSAGSHSLHVARRETGYMLDRLLLTTDSGFTPSGAGPAESSRSGSGAMRRITVAVSLDGASVLIDANIIPADDPGTANGDDSITFDELDAAGNYFIELMLQLAGNG